MTSLLLQYMFSAILGRDQVYQTILDHGMILGLSWGSDVIGETRRSRSTPRGSTSSNASRDSPDSGASVVPDLKSF